MKRFGIMLGIINACALFISILCFSISIPASSEWFYEMEYTKMNTAERIGVSREDLTIVTRHLIGYMQDYPPMELNVAIPINGEVRDFYNQREIDHMVDVRYLFEILHTIRFISIVVFIATIGAMLFLKLKPLQLLGSVYRVFFSVSLAATALLALVIAAGFETAFNTFHEIFFTNDLWWLNPDTDLLINIVPLQFFIDITVFIGVIYLTLSAAALLFSFLTRRKYGMVRE